MKIMHTVLLFAWLLLSKFVVSQTRCAKDKIIGSWDYIFSCGYEPNYSIDTLIKKANNLNEIIASWTYNDNNTYSYKNQITKHKSKGYFKITEDKCEIRLGKRKKTSQELIFHLLYLDDTYLIERCEKNKGNFIYVYKRRSN